MEGLSSLFIVPKEMNLEFIAKFRIVGAGTFVMICFIKYIFQQAIHRPRTITDGSVYLTMSLKP